MTERARCGYSRLERLPGVLVVALTLMLASCGRDDGAVGPGPQVGTTDIGAAAVETLRDGGTFRWTLPAFPPNFNYHHIDGPYFPNKDVTGSVMPYLFVGQADGTVKINENYLKSAELTSTNPQVATYTLRDEATWSDGTPITWRDFQAQWQALNGSNKAFQISSSVGYSDIASVMRGTSDKQVIVTFARLFSDWQSPFSLLYPASTNTNPDIFNTGWTQRLPVTAGPFKVEQVDQTTKTITVVRDERWWGRKPRLDRIVFRAIPPEAGFDALANNEVDAMDIGPDLNSFTRAQSTTGVQVRTALAPDFRHITFNGKPGSVLADQQLRIAIQEGIDRQAIVQAQIGRLVRDPTPLGNHIFVQGQRGYQDNSGMVAYNPDKASKTLDQLGWTRQGEGTRSKNGRELVLRYVIPAQAPVAVQEFRQMQQFLSRIGVRLEITLAPLGDLFDKYVNPGNFDIVSFGWFGAAFPISTKGSIYGTRGDTQQNYGGIGNEAINNLFAEANRELDPTRRIELANQIDQEIWKTGHSLLLYQRPNIVAVRAGVANFGAFGFADPIYTDIGLTR